MLTRPLSLCPVPKWTRRKYEVATKELNNPIKQDEKKGVLREYKARTRTRDGHRAPRLLTQSVPSLARCVNVVVPQWGDMLFNYGFFPQTWEDPEHTDPDTNCRGDNDPLDVVEVGARQMRTGECVPVKVLGVLGMIDDGETDWKVFVIRVDDPLAPRVHDLDSLESELPGAVTALREWLRVYKIPEGKALNAFSHDEEAQPRAYALKVVADTHAAWRKSHGAIQKTNIGRSGTGYGILSSPSMSELEVRGVWQRSDERKGTEERRAQKQPPLLPCSILIAALQAQRIADAATAVAAASSLAPNGAAA